MKLKKILAVLCVCALAVSLTVPVFATATTPPHDASVEFPGGFPDQDLEVAVSVLYAMRKLYVNPYGLPYNIKTTAFASTNGSGSDNDATSVYEETVSAGWFSNTAVIKNLSPNPLPVSVTIKTVEQGDARVVVDADDAESYPANNCLYGNFEITKATNEDGVITPADWGLIDGTSITEADDTHHMRQVAIPATGAPVATTNTFFSVDGVHGEYDDDLGEDVDVPGYAAFRIRGGAVIRTMDGTSGDIGEWDDGTGSTPAGRGDVVDVTISFTFG